jgi:hypothetical protein
MNQQILSSSAVSEGTWIQVDNLILPFTVSIYGFDGVGDVAQIYVSNSYAQPPAVAPVAGDGTQQYGSDYNSDTWVEIAVTFRWLRVRKSAAGVAPATTVARIQGQERVGRCPV